MEIPRETTTAARERHLSRSEVSALFLVLLAVRLLLVAAVALLLQGRGSAAGGAVATPPNPFVSDPLWLVVGTVASECAIFAVLVGGYLVLRPTLGQALPLRLPRLSGVVGALLVTFGLMPLAEGCAELVGRLDPTASTSSERVIEAVRQCTPEQLPWLVLGLAVVPAVVEEAAFRGAITAGFRGSPVRALLLPSLMFGLFHLDPAQVAATTVLGLAFGLARLATGSLVTSVVAHAVYNTAVLLMMYSGDPRVDAAPAELAIPAGLVVAVAGLLFFRAGGTAPAREA